MFDFFIVLQSSLSDLKQRFHMEGKCISIYYGYLNEGSWFTSALILRVMDGFGSKPPLSLISGVRQLAFFQIWLNVAQMETLNTLAPYLPLYVVMLYMLPSLVCK